MAKLVDANSPGDPHWIIKDVHKNQVHDNRVPLFFLDVSSQRAVLNDIRFWLEHCKGRFEPGEAATRKAPKALYINGPVKVSTAFFLHHSTPFALVYHHTQVVAATRFPEFLPQIQWLKWASPAAYA